MNPRAIGWKDLLLPKEHGSWSLAFEPVALALLVAPTRAGAGLALAAAAGFFARRPLKLAITLPASDPRQRAARNWAVILPLVAAAALAATLALGGARPLWPLLLAAPCGGLFLWLDLRSTTRGAEAELAGSAAFALLPAAAALLAGWPAPPALALATLALARNVPTVLTVRTYLRRGRNEIASTFPPLAAAAAAPAAIALLAGRGWVPGAAVALSALLLIRTGWLVSAFRPNWAARRLGIMEALLGIVQLGILTVAYHRP
jgi:hypothetical protein